MKRALLLISAVFVLAALIMITILPEEMLYADKLRPLSLGESGRRAAGAFADADLIAQSLERYVENMRKLWAVLNEVTEITPDQAVAVASLLKELNFLDMEYLRQSVLAIYDEMYTTVAGQRVLRDGRLMSSLVFALNHRLDRIREVLQARLNQTELNQRAPLLDLSYWVIQMRAGAGSI